MKRLLLASTACLGWAVAAQAADLPARAAPVYAPPPPVFTWTGFYVGANAGYAFETRRRDDDGAFVPSTLTFPGNNFAFCGSPGTIPGAVTATGPCPGASGFTSTNPLFPNATPFYVIGNNGNPGPFGANPFAAPGTTLLLGNNNPALLNQNRRRDGFTGGGQIGYNWQLTPGAGLVVGLEADAQFADLNRRNDFALFGNGLPGGGAITVGPGVVGAPFFTNPVVVPLQVGAAQAIPAIAAGANPVGTGALSLAFTGTGAAGVALPPGPFNTGFGGVFLNNGPFVGTAAQNASVQPVGPVTFFDPRNFNRNNQRGIDWFGTVRGRLGYGFNRALLYVTGGFAYGGSDRNDHFADGFGVGGLAGPGFGLGGFGLGGGNCTGVNNCSDRIRLGWTAGAGLEYSFTDQWSVKLEGLYVSLDDRRGNNNNFALLNGPIPYARDAGGNVYFAPAGAFNNGGGFFNSRSRDFEFAVVRVGLNYHFNFMAPTPAPVVARY